VGTVYSVEYVTDLAQTNSWRCLEFLQPPASPYLWADKSAPATGQRFYRAVVFAAPTNLVFIPPGTFRMGSPTNEVDRFDWEGPQTAVTISRGFWMGRFEVTQAEYLAVMGNNPSVVITGEPNRPVENVSWHDATNYCSKLAQQEQAAGRIPANSLYRLPTEAEWEYACRAGRTTPFGIGDGTSLSSTQANFDGNFPYGGAAPSQYLNETTLPGRYEPNAWGLYDMHGNVSEWCQDWYDSLPGGVQIDPTGPPGPVQFGTKVMRGGAYDYPNSSCRSASRLFFPATNTDTDLGFRVVFVIGP